MFWQISGGQENGVSGYTFPIACPHSSLSFRPLSCSQLPQDFDRTELVCTRVVAQNWVVVEVLVYMHHINYIYPPSFLDGISI